MRQKRAKTYKRLMALYSLSFGFRQPYQVLVDSQMCTTVVDQKIDLAKQLPVIMQGPVKLMITQCCIHELYLQGKTQQPAVDLAKTFERRKCNHREAIPGDDCVTSVIGESNKHRYAVATQSHPLRVKLRQVPAVPIVHINRAVIILEPPSDATMAAKDNAEQQRLRPSVADLALSKPKPCDEPPKKKRKGPKGPNPLSVMKKGGNKSIVRTKTEGEKQLTRGTASARILVDDASLESALTGEKRKRGVDDGDAIGDSTKPCTDNTIPSSRKRKRRRKGKGGQEDDS